MKVKKSWKRFVTTMVTAVIGFSAVSPIVSNAYVQNEYPYMYKAQNTLYSKVQEDYTNPGQKLVSLSYKTSPSDFEGRENDKLIIQYRYNEGEWRDYSVISIGGEDLLIGKNRRGLPVSQTDLLEARVVDQDMNVWVDEDEVITEDAYDPEYPDYGKVVLDSSLKKPTIKVSKNPVKQLFPDSPDYRVSIESGYPVPCLPSFPGGIAHMGKALLSEMTGDIQVRYSVEYKTEFSQWSSYTPGSMDFLFDGNDGKMFVKEREKVYAVVVAEDSVTGKKTRSEVVEVTVSKESAKNENLFSLLDYFYLSGNFSDASVEFDPYDNAQKELKIREKLGISKEVYDYLNLANAPFNEGEYVNRDAEIEALRQKIKPEDPLYGLFELVKNEMTRMMFCEFGGGGGSDGSGDDGGSDGSGNNGDSSDKIVDLIRDNELEKVKDEYGVSDKVIDVIADIINSGDNPTSGDLIDAVEKGDKVPADDPYKDLVEEKLKELGSVLKDYDIMDLIARERYDILSKYCEMSKPSYVALVQVYFATKYTGSYMFKNAKEKVELVSTDDKYYVLALEQYNKLITKYDEFVAETKEREAVQKAEISVSTMEKMYDSTLAVSTQQKIDAVGSPEKRAELQNRLNQAKAKYLADKQAKAEQEALTAVAKAEETRTSTSVNVATSKVGALETGAVKTELSNRLHALDVEMKEEKNFADAKRAVEFAERYKTSSYVTTAQTKINAMADGSDKTALQQRLDAVKSQTPSVSDQSQIVAKAKSALSLAQSLKKQSYVDKAQTAINLVEDETVKSELQTKLNAIVVK